MRAARDAKNLRKEPELKVPQGLVDAINSGNCVAFVGAGFSAAARLPGWKDLLLAILDRGVEDEKINDTMKGEIANMIQEGSSSSLDRSAQIMEDRLGTQVVSEVVAEQLQYDPEKLPPEMVKRLKLLFNIPFKAILTTNFDGFLPGVPAAHEDAKPVMRKILRAKPLTLVQQILREISISNTIGANIPALKFDPEKHAAFKEVLPEFNDAMDFFNDETCIMNPPEEEDRGSDDGEADEEEEEDPLEAMIPVIQLHGTVVGDESYKSDPGLAFTRLGYRKLLHGGESYSKFISSVMASSTILYLGFSFSDEYINEMRSSTMMMLSPDRKAPIAYAISIGKPPSEIAFYEKHEGINLLNYEPKKGSPGFEGIEEWLGAIEQRVNPLYRWGKCIHQKTIALLGTGAVLALARFLLVYTNHQYGYETNIQVLSLDEDEEVNEEFMATFKKMFKEKGPFDLMVVEYRLAEKLLSFMDNAGERSCPVLVTETSFGEDDEKKKTHVQHRRAVMRNGAAGYINDLESILTEIRHVLMDARFPTKASMCVAM